MNEQNKGPVRYNYTAASVSHARFSRECEINKFAELSVSSQDLLLISYPRFKVLSTNLVQHMTVLRRWKFWEYLPLLASVAGCSWLWISAFLFRRKLSLALKKGVTGQRGG